MSHAMQSNRDIARFMLGGNATFTLKSMKTGAHFTYRLRAPKDGDGKVFFLSIMSGSNNESDYSYVGMVKVDNGVNLIPTKKSRVGIDAPSVKGFKWLVDAVMHASASEVGKFHDQAEFFHEDRCGCCGRKLTTPESIERGIGPECLKHIN